MGYADRDLFVFGGSGSCDRKTQLVCVGDGPKAGGAGGADAGTDGEDGGTASALEGSWNLLNPSADAGASADLALEKRLLFRGNSYTSVWTTSSVYCGETGTFRITPDGVAFHPVRIEGYFACLIGSDRTESFSKTGSEISFVLDGQTSRYARAPEVAKLFITFETHNGDFAGDPTLAGTGAFEKADTFCNQSSAKPNGQTYKAVLVDETRRSASPAIDWVLKPNTAYFRADGVTPAVTTDATGVYPRNTYVPVLRIDFWDKMYTWTGLNSDNTTYRETCAGWTTAAPTVRASAAQATADLRIAVLASCSNMNHGIFCASQ